MTALLCLLLAAGPPAAAGPVADGRAALFGSVPAGTPTAEPLRLSLTDAIQRGLERNLGLVLAQQGLAGAEAARREALAALLPHLDGQLSAARQKISLEAFGFTGPGIPRLVGPFNVFDARLGATQTVFDWSAIQKERRARERQSAAELGYRDTRELVVLVCGSLYFQSLAEQARIEAARAQVARAQALDDLARDRKQSGLSPAIDLLRAEVELKNRQQQLLAAGNRLARAKLSLARAIGLPPGQEFELTDQMSEQPAPPLQLDEALRTAYEKRADWQAAQAEAGRQAALGEGLPRLGVAADWGVIGQSVDGALQTYSVGAALRVPLFEGGRNRAKRQQAVAELAAQRARLEDQRARIDFEVRSAAFDLDTAREQVAVARGARELAEQQLTQARDRFEAGVASNLEVVQAQQALAEASESWVASLFDQSLAKAQMARALGLAESAYRELVRGE
jgi:outer membrane protein TolC